MPYTQEITKEHIAAWRKADYVVYAMAGTDNGNVAWIKLGQRQRTNDNGWIKPESHDMIDDLCGTLIHYGRKDDQVRASFYDTHGAGTVSHTVGRFLRAGDKLEIHFVGSNNNEQNKEIGWHRDECWLKVVRGNKGYDFLIGVQVGPDNSARMVGGSY